MRQTISVLALLLLLCPCVQGQDFIWGDFESWQVTFYELDSTVTVQVDTFMQGDTIQVLWRQPLTSKPLDQQPGPNKFSNTGKFINISVSRQDMDGFASDGRAVYNADVALSPGMWAVGVKAVLVKKNDDGSNIVSTQGGWDPIYVSASSGLPPDAPVLIEVRLRPGG